jgi:hypothetical protein
MLEEIIAVWMGATRDAVESACEELHDRSSRRGQNKLMATEYSPVWPGLNRFRVGLCGWQCCREALEPRDFGSKVGPGVRAFNTCASRSAAGAAGGQNRCRFGGLLDGLGEVLAEIMNGGADWDELTLDQREELRASIIGLLNLPYDGLCPPLEAL